MNPLAAVGAFVRKTLTSKSAGSPQYEESFWDAHLMGSAVLHDADTMAQMILEAENGWPLRFYPFMDQMRAQDAHLDAEIQKATDYLTGPRVDFMPYPAVTRDWTGPGKVASTEEALSQATCAYAEKLFNAPDVRMDSAVASLCNGFWKGIGGFQQILVPDGQDERVVSITELPAQRFRYAPGTTTWLFQPTGDFSQTVPLSELGPNGDASLVMLMADPAVPSLARRGIIRRCFNLWLIKHRGLVWWANAVEKFGAPFRAAYYSKGANDTEIEKILKSLAKLGSFGYGAFQDGTKLDIKEAAMRIASSTPHEQIADWCDRAMSKAIHGHDQSAGVRVDAGSKQSQQHGDDVAIRRSQSRARILQFVLREGMVRPAIARRFGPDVARAHTPIVSIRVEHKKDLLALSESYKNFAEAGVETIPVAVFHEQTGIRQAEPGEPTIKRAAPASNVLPFGSPPSKGGARRAVRVSAGFFATESVKDAQRGLTGSQDAAEPYVEGSGEEIVAAYRKTIGQALDEGATIEQAILRVLQLVVKGKAPTPKLEDLITAARFESEMRGIETQREEHG